MKIDTKMAPKSHQKSADPRSGVLEHFDSGGGFLPPTPLHPGGLQPTPRRVSFKGHQIAQNPRRVSFKAKNACGGKSSVIFVVTLGCFEIKRHLPRLLGLMI